MSTSCRSAISAPAFPGVAECARAAARQGSCVDAADRKPALSLRLRPLLGGLCLPAAARA
jgi:hypothetical protein